MRRLPDSWFSAMRLSFVVALAATAALTSGCADMRLHSPTRDKQGDVAKEAWVKVDVKGQLAAARELQAGILTRQQAVLATTAQNNRELLIRQVAYGGPIGDSVTATVMETMKGLTGSSAYAVDPFCTPGPKTTCGLTSDTWVGALKTEEDWAEGYAKIKFGLTRFGLELPSCKTWAEKKAAAEEPFTKWLTSRPADDPSKKVVADLIKEAKDSCLMTERTASAAPRTRLGGTLKALADKVDEATADLAAYEEKGKETRNSYVAAKSVYDAATARLKSGKGTADQVQAAAGNLETAAKALVELDGLFSEKVLSEARRDSLGRFVDELTALSTGKDLPADSGRFLVALKVLPGLVDSTQQSLLDAKKPMLVPLVIRSDQERLKVETLNRDIATLRLHEKLLRQQLAVAAKRAAMLSAPLNYFTNLSAAEKAMTLSALHDDIASKANADDNHIVLYRALSRLLYSEGALYGQQLQLEFQANALSYERNVSYAEGAVLQWHALIDSTVAQLDAYAKSGIKTETLTGLVNALGVLWIGHGVNK